MERERAREQQRVRLVDSVGRQRVGAQNLVRYLMGMSNSADDLVPNGRLANNYCLGRRARCTEPCAGMAVAASMFSNPEYGRCSVGIEWK
eukprot:SAG11_NODE_217_length_12229_cov_9.152185_11_plen_90_part_00